MIGFDIERHRYPKFVRPETALKLPGNGTGRWADRTVKRLGDATKVMQQAEGWDEYPGELVLEDVLTLHGSQFRNADCIVASPPCQAYSYRAMPWKRAKALPPPDNTLFDACFRIQREASEAAGRHIPMVVENVRGAEKWVGKAKWHVGSFYLWGDVPALMCIERGHKNARNWWSDGRGNLSATTSSHSPARKAASAQIAKIPFPLAEWIARVYKPT